MLARAWRSAAAFDLIHPRVLANSYALPSGSGSHRLWKFYANKLQLTKDNVEYYHINRVVSDSITVNIHLVNIHAANVPPQIDAELTAFKQQLPFLLAQYGIGKFALFIGGIFKGVFTDRVEALKNGYSQGGPGHFLVRKITEQDEVYHMASPVAVW
jgi:hypothetical protein